MIRDMASLKSMNILELDELRANKLQALKDVQAWLTKHTEKHDDYELMGKQREALDEEITAIDKERFKSLNRKPFVNNPISFEL
jgi:hypothetical protein